MNTGNVSNNFFSNLSFSQRCQKCNKTSSTHINYQWSRSDKGIMSQWHQGDSKYLDKMLSIYQSVFVWMSCLALTGSCVVCDWARCRNEFNEQRQQNEDKEKWRNVRVTGLLAIHLCMELRVNPYWFHPSSWSSTGEHVHVLSLALLVVPCVSDYGSPWCLHEISWWIVVVICKEDL